MWLAYFFDAGEKMDRLEKIQEELTFSVLRKLAFAALTLAFLIGIVQIINARKRAMRMTKTGNSARKSWLTGPTEW